MKISDETRPFTQWITYRGVEDFLRTQFGRFLEGYWRDYMQSQPMYIEILGEKNTLQPIIRDIAWEYCIPYTIGRGYCSLRPRYDLTQRFLASGKEKLLLLILSDFDPDGEEIAHSFVRSLRDDLAVDAEAVKVALTHKQVSELYLPESYQMAKEGSSNYKKFVHKYGTSVYELEALPQQQLQKILRETIESVIDVDLFEKERELERTDAHDIAVRKGKFRIMLSEPVFSQPMRSE